MYQPATILEEGMVTKTEFRRFHDGTLVCHHIDSNGNVELTLETLANERAVLLLANVQNLQTVKAALELLRPHDVWRGHLAEVVGVGFDHDGPQGKKRVCIDLGFPANHSIEIICDSFALL